MNFLEFKEKYQKAEVLEFSSSTPKNPIVSVLVQTYQHKDFIGECLDSILMQETTFEYEILIGEDGSVDGTREICIEYANKYPEKIRLFLHHPENKISVLNNITGNFNALYNFYSAKGKYIAFCEGDDKWGDPLKLQRQVEFLENNPDFVLSFHRYRENYEIPIKDQPKLLEQVVHNISEEQLQRLLFHPLLSTVCFRNIITELPSEISEVINVDSFPFSLLGAYGDAKYQDEISPGIYRIHFGGIWSIRNKELKLKTKIQTFNSLIIYYMRQNNHELVKFFKATKRNHVRMLFLHYLKHFKFFKTAFLLRKL